MNYFLKYVLLSNMYTFNNAAERTLNEKFKIKLEINPNIFTHWFCSPKNRMQFLNVFILFLLNFFNSKK